MNASNLIGRRRTLEYRAATRFSFAPAILQLSLRLMSIKTATSARRPSCQGTMRFSVRSHLGRSREKR